MKTDLFDARIRRLIEKYRSTVDFVSLFRYLNRDLQQIMGAEQALFFLVVPAIDAVRFRSFPGSPEKGIHSTRFELVRDDAFVTSLRREKGLFEFRGRESALFETLGINGDRDGSRPVSLFVLPLRRKKVLGVYIFVNSRFQRSELIQHAAQIANLQQFLAHFVTFFIKSRMQKREALERDILLKVAREISSSLKLETVLNSIIDSMRKVVPYDSAALFLINHNTGKIDYEIARGYSQQARNQLHLKIGQGVSGWVAKTGRSLIVRDVSREPRYVRVDPDTRSELAVPIRAGRKVIGVFNLESHRCDVYTPRRKKLLEAFAASAAVAIQNARLYRVSLEKKELEKELSIATKIQQTLLPRSLPSTRSLKLIAFNQPSKRVGGDLYDAFRTVDGRIAMAVGDVSGKGVPGAILMATLHAIYRTEIRRDLSPKRLITRINKQFHENIEVGKFATFFHAVVDIDGRMITYCNAGHNPAILLRADGSHELLHSTGLILGLIADAEYQEKKIDFMPGDLLVAYSDGIVEAENKDEELFGLERLIEVVAKNHRENVHVIKKAILTALKQFSHKLAAQDDITFMVLKFENLC